MSPTRVPGLDDILGGGLPRDRVFLAQGDPGTGKTTLGLQWLMAGARDGEPGLYIALSETRDELLSVGCQNTTSRGDRSFWMTVDRPPDDPSHDRVLVLTPVGRDRFC